MSRTSTPIADAEEESKKRPKPLTYRTIPTQDRDTNDWDKCSIDHLDNEKQKRFSRLQVGVIDYLATGALGAAASQAGCSTKALTLQVNRCLARKPDGRILGWAGLIKGLRVNRYTRKSPAPVGPQTSSRGNAGRFIEFIAGQKLARERLHKLIEAGGGESKTKPSKHPEVRSVATQFIRYLKRQDPQCERYPLNAGKSQGRRSIERYVRNYLDTTSSATAVWEGKDVARGRKVGTGLFSFDFVEEIFSMCQIDAHREDCIGTVIIDGSRGPRPVVIDRMTILPVVDIESHAVCGYELVIRPEAGAKHVEEALLNCTVPWKPRQLKIKGLAYDPQGGFPVGCIEGLEEIRPAGVSLDNAAINYSNATTDKIRKVFGCAVTWGEFAGWWRRAVIERFFGILEHYGFKRLSSSMGKGPEDPLRDDPLGHAVSDGIEWDELVDLLDVLLANFNGAKLEALDGLSPLDHIRGRMASRSDSFVPRPPVQATLMTPPLGVEVEYAHIRGGGKKNPYVELDGPPYSNKVLSLRRDWIGREVVLHIPRKDIRTLQVFQASGEPIGEVQCLERRWRRSAHSRDQRKTINALSNAGKLYVSPDDDPIVVYAKHLADKAYESAGKGRPRISTDATKLAELAHSTGIDIPDTTPPPPTPPRSRRSLPPGFEELGQ